MTQPQPINFHALHAAISDLAAWVKGWDIGDLPADMTCSEANSLARVLAWARETEAAALVIYYHGFSDSDGPEEDGGYPVDWHHDVYLAAQPETGKLPIDGEALRLAYQHVAALIDEERDLTGGTST